MIDATNLKRSLSKSSRPRLTADEAAAEYKSLLSAAARDGDQRDVSDAARADRIASASEAMGYDVPRVMADLGNAAQAHALLAVSESTSRLEIEARNADAALADHVLATEVDLAKLDAASAAQEAKDKLVAEREAGRVSHTVATQRAHQRLAAARTARSKFEKLAESADVVDESLLRPVTK